MTSRKANMFAILAVASLRGGGGARDLPNICRAFHPQMKCVVPKFGMGSSKSKSVGCIILSYLLDQIILH